MTHSFIGLALALVIIGILVYDRIRYGKAVSHGSSKANTVHTIRTSNDTVIRLYDAVISDIIERENI